MTTLKINNEINGLMNEKNKLEQELMNSMNDNSFYGNEKRKTLMISNINFLNTTLDSKVREFEQVNTSILSKIEELNKRNKDKQKIAKELKQLYQSNKNLSSGIEVALKDSNTMYSSVMKNILLKTSALIVLYYYIYKS